MADNINFIPASELPTTEAESGAVSFLCEENGEMKRFPGNKVGGGAGGYIMKPTAEEVTMENTATTISANYDEMAKVLEAGGHATVVLPAGILGDNAPAFALSVIAWTYVEGNGLVAIGSVGDAVLTLTFPNGTYIPNME